MTSNAVGTKVVIVGAGISGPVLAIFLKLKGYQPVVYERAAGLPDAGIGHCLQSNGLRVLSKIPGLVESIEGAKLGRFAFYSVLPEDKGILAEYPIPEDNPTLGVRRAALQKALVEAAERVGVEIKWGHHLSSLDQGDDSVTVTFENGEKDTGSFVVGCDGLHSNTRVCLFGTEKADFTGLVQTGGICPTPDTLKNPPALINIFGNGAHIVAYAVNDRQCAWATSAKEPEAKESWRAQGADVKEAIKKSKLADWDFGGAELVKNAEQIVKYGLYDRPELKTWHQGRVVLIGDAAHPTSPHLGQGANQAFEDIDLLTELLEKHNPSTASPATAVLEALFTEFEGVRIPRSSMMVKGARAQGESRVLEGVEACLKRNQVLRDMLKDEESFKKQTAKLHSLANEAAGRKTMY